MRNFSGFESRDKLASSLLYNPFFPSESVVHMKEQSLRGNLDATLKSTQESQMNSREKIDSLRHCPGTRPDRMRRTQGRRNLSPLRYLHALARPSVFSTPSLRKNKSGGFQGDTPGNGEGVRQITRRVMPLEAKRPDPAWTRPPVTERRPSDDPRRYLTGREVAPTGAFPPGRRQRLPPPGAAW